MVDELLDSLLEMFRRTSPVSTDLVIGLWGELLAIDTAIDRAAYVRGWHNKSSETFDFDLDGSRVEVKTSLKPDRSHEFSLGQVRPARETDFVLSLHIRRATAGLHVLALARRIADKLPIPERDRLWRIILETLGPELEGVDDHCFDEAFARDAMRLYLAADIPAPTVPEALGAVISGVRFTATLGGVKNVPLVAAAMAVP